MFEAFIQAVERYDCIILHRHSHPDGDALGSQIGLKHLLLAAYPHKRVFMVGDAAGRYAFMADSVMDEVPDEAYREALAVVLDTSAPALISDGRYARAAQTARIDHHLFIAPICQVEVVDASFESCCGLVTALAQEADWPVPKEAAEALFLGMVTDSERFRYDQTNAGTFRRAAFLMEHGVQFTPIYAALYRETLSDRKRRAAFTDRICVTSHGVGYVYSDAASVEAFGLSPQDLSRAMVNEMADLEGVKIWVNFTESSVGVLCELRSGDININPVAVKYGGGGHKKASGATVANRETAMDMLRDLDALAGGEA